MKYLLLAALCAACAGAPTEPPPVRFPHQCNDCRTGVPVAWLHVDTLHHE